MLSVAIVDQGTDCGMTQNVALHPAPPQQEVAAAAPAQQEVAAAAPGTVSTGFSPWKNPHTGQLIPVSQVQDTIDALHLASIQLDQGSVAFKQTLWNLPPSMPWAVREAFADKARQKCTGGLTKAKVLEKLCEDGHLVKLNVICPPIPSKNEIKLHEESLLLMMSQFHRNAHELMYDMFTSRWEHDTWGVKPVHVYVSFPFHYAAYAEDLAFCLRLCKSGTHQLDAWVSDSKKKQAVVPWESTMSGTVLPSLTPEEIQDTLKPVNPAVYKAQLEADLKD